MPCYDPGYAQLDLMDSRKELDRLTDMLCATLNHLRQNPVDLRLEIYNGLPVEVRSWYKAHRAIDIKTKEIELRNLDSKINDLNELKKRMLEEINQMELENE